MRKQIKSPGIEVIVFEKEGTSCREKVEEVVKDFIGKIKGSGSIRYSYYDLNCGDGLTEGAFNDVRGAPATLIKDSSGKVVERWERIVPSKKELVSAINKYK